MAIDADTKLLHWSVVQSSALQTSYQTKHLFVVFRNTAYKMTSSYGRNRYIKKKK